MLKRMWLKYIAVAMLFWVPGLAIAQSCKDLPPERSVTDGQEGCLALVPVGNLAEDFNTIVVMLHGDGGGVLSTRDIDGWTKIGKSLQAPQRKVMLMIRPGYHSPSGDSSGWANPHDDDYTAENIERVAGALEALRNKYGLKHLVLLGHSGGAATSALVMGKHPGIVDGALLLSCPCDVPPWRAHRNAQRGRSGGWVHSLNPLEYAARIPANSSIMVATGSFDDNTLPKFGSRWAAAASAKGASVKFDDVLGRDHRSIKLWPEIADRIDALVQSLRN